MSVRFILWLLAGILMIVAAFVPSPRVSIATLAWGLFILGWAFDGGLEVN